MKHIYIDVSNLNNDEFSYIHQEISNLNSFCDKECCIKFVRRSMEKELLFCLDNNSEITFSSIETGAVYFDIISSGKSFPSKNFLYKSLRMYGIQIASYLPLAVLNALLNPIIYEDSGIMYELECISGIISYASFVFMENHKAYKSFNELCMKINIKHPPYDVISQESLFKILCSISREEGSVCCTDVNQMAVLTARNNNILNSLPYIETFMPFIKKLIICCPTQNVKSFKEKYKGRLYLQFLTDDELLSGESLPYDHQARNFFLRCKLMEQDILDDVFIMADDDYRPIKPIAQEFFIKDGRYQGYYFYDIRQWQGTYNNYTSFDMGAFQTRDFLISNGYPTLQYSSHQPQIIDKNIFKEMLSVHNGIENNPYDEWSTYFNYGFYTYPDKFNPCESVSMCWPGDLSSWDIHHIPCEYFFENYYEELYKKGQMFEGFSETYNENIGKENLEKASIYRKNSIKQFKDREVFLLYQKEYADKTGVYPSIVISFDEKTQKVYLTVPEYINLAVDSWTRIPIAIQTPIYNNADISISYHFKNSFGVPVLNSPEIPIEKGDKRIMLPVRSPVSMIKNAILTVRVILRENKGNCFSDEKQSDFIIQRNMKLILNKTDEVNYV